MYSRILLASILFLLLSCSGNDDSPNDNDPQAPAKKYLTSFTNVGETTTDTLVYSDNRLILRKEYVGDFLDYNHHFVYNNLNQLIRITKIHSTATYPNMETTYTYYTDGNLKTRHYEGYNSNYTETFTYHDNIIYVNEGTNNEQRINLNLEGQIVSLDNYFEDVNDFFNTIKFEYGPNGNLTKIAHRYGRNEPYRTFIYTFDDKINPLFVFDYNLPNGFTIKQLEAVLSQSNYGGYSPGDDDNMFIYFSKNNFTSIQSENGVGSFNFEYNTENYPTKISLPYSSNDRYLALTYQQ
jgi:hypothetical protein